MKILAVGSHVLEDNKKQSAVDIWRLRRPLNELAKNTDWQIDHQPTYIPGMDKYSTKEEFTEEELEKAFKKICEYDIVFSSYHPDPAAYSLLRVANKRKGVQFVLDVDDDMFAINPDNPFWMKMDHEHVYQMQCMIRDNDWITTPSPTLAKAFRERRKRPADSVEVLPNFISDEYKHPKFDNSPEIVIGYFGGSSHYLDLHQTGILPALGKLMNENKNIRFKSVGMLVDEYIPTKRFEFDGGQRGDKWLTDVFPNLKMDIALGPLLENIFNNGKSNIKWQEATRAGAVFVASRVGPYKSLKKGTAVLVDNKRSEWYDNLKQLVENEEKRKEVLRNAQKELQENWRTETNWERYRDFFQRVKSGSRDNNVQPPKILVAGS